MIFTLCFFFFSGPRLKCIDPSPSNRPAMYALSVSGIISSQLLSVHVPTASQRLQYSGLPICNLQRCLARSIFCHLELVLFYSVKFYFASCVIIHLTVAVVGSNPSNLLVHAVRTTIINPTKISCFIKFSLRVTVPTLVYCITHLCCPFKYPLPLQVGQMVLLL